MGFHLQYPSQDQECKRCGLVSGRTLFSMNCEPTVHVPVNAEEVNISLSMLSSSFSDSFHFQFERRYSELFHVFQPKEATVVDNDR